MKREINAIKFGYRCTLCLHTWYSRRNKKSVDCPSCRRRVGIQKIKRLITTVIEKKTTYKDIPFSE